MDLFLKVIIVLLTFACMEGVAWFTHKYVMHGFLWALHKDHHKPNHKHAFEKNDSFFLIFATPGITFILLGLNTSMWYLLWVGVGITLYGMAYFFIHDLFIHQRIRVLRNTNNEYLKSIRKAHKVHHKSTEKENGVCFGMLFVPRKYHKASK